VLFVGFTGRPLGHRTQDVQECWSGENDKQWLYNLATWFGRSDEFREAQRQFGTGRPGRLGRSLVIEHHQPGSQVSSEIEGDGHARQRAWRGGRVPA